MLFDMHFKDAILIGGEGGREACILIALGRAQAQLQQARDAYFFEFVIIVFFKIHGIYFSISTPLGAKMADLTLLGNQNTQYDFNYNPKILETFENKHPEYDYFVKFNCPEFTSLCPMTGQPDFATIYINYIPQLKMVESKSLKLYLFSFRNHGDFHEDCINIIMKDLIALMQPKFIEVCGKFLPRGGLSIDPYVNYGMPQSKYEEMAQYRLLHHDLQFEKVDNR